MQKELRHQTNLVIIHIKVLLEHETLPFFHWHPDREPLYALLGKRKDITAASIRTAWDPYLAAGALKTQEWPGIVETMFADLGATAEVVDPKLYKGKPGQLRQKLASFDLVWVHGGNSFYLNYWLDQCSFKSVMLGLFKQGVVYGGESAGAVVTCPNLHGIEFADDPNDAPEVIFEGMGFIDFAIIPHWNNPKYTHVLKKAKVEAKRHNKKVVTLGDTECLAVRDGVIVSGDVI